MPINIRGNCRHLPFLGRDMLTEVLTEMVKIKEYLELKKKENAQFAAFLNNLGEASPFMVSRSVHELAAGFSKVVDCTKCGNCCKFITIHITGEDRRKLARRLNITENEFRSVYCRSTDKGWAFTDLQCPFLENNCCTVYEDRPGVCHAFPYLNLDSMTMDGIGFSKGQELVAMAYRCPIMFNVLEELKKISGFTKTLDNQEGNKPVEPEQTAIEEPVNGQKKPELVPAGSAV